MKELIKILIINQFASTPSFSTGSGERHYYLAKHLIQVYKFVIITGSYSHLLVSKPHFTGKLKEEIISGGKFIWIKLRSYKSSSKIGRIISWFEFLSKLFLLKRSLIANTSVVIVSSMSIWPIFFAIWIQKLYKIPFVLEVRDLWPLTLVQEGGYSKKNPLIWFFSLTEKLAYRRSDAIISLLPNFESYYKTLLPNHNKRIFIIPNAIETDSLKEEESNKPSSDVFIIGYIGSLGIANNMSCFIEAAELLLNYPKIKFYIKGDGPLRQNLAKKATLLSNVQFFEKENKHVVHSFLYAIDVCFISWHNYDMYQFGVSANKYNDYMLGAKPIISASNIPDDPVVLARCGFQVPSGDANAIANAILQLYNMKEEERNIIGKKGYEYVMKNNTYEIIATKYKQCLDEVISSNTKS